MLHLPKCEVDRICSIYPTTTQTLERKDEKWVEEGREKRRRLGPLLLLTGTEVNFVSSPRAAGIEPDYF